MGSSRARHSTRANSRARLSSNDSDFPAITGAFADAVAIVETAAIAIEATERHAAATVTLRTGIRALLDAYALLDQAKRGTA